MRAPFATLQDAAAGLGEWLWGASLPLWTTQGVDAASGAFQEALTLDGRPRPPPRRARVQARQIWVCATAAAAGQGDPYAALARRGHEGYRARYRRADGLFAFNVDGEGRILDPTPALYEQSFTLLALSALHRLDPEAGHAVEARALLAAMEALRHPAGGWREAGAQPFQANAHMHLFEAALAWEDAGEGAWASLADEVAALALQRFIKPGQAVLREFFDARWRPLGEGEGQRIEPGHQFEWATLLDRWATLRGRDEVRALARSLYQTGLRGVDGAAGAALNALDAALGVADGGGRLWAQTEYLKAALLFGDQAQALGAANGLAGYLATPKPGVWRDKRRADGGFVDEPAPATSLYHLMGAILPLEAWV
jgi:mannose-6-phosphate isomerase